jgi:hypothetical protein
MAAHFHGVADIEILSVQGHRAQQPVDMQEIVIGSVSRIKPRNVSSAAKRARLE